MGTTTQLLVAVTEKKKERKKSPLSGASSTQRREREREMGDFSHQLAATETDDWSLSADCGQLLKQLLVLGGQVRHRPANVADDGPHLNTFNTWTMKFYTWERFNIIRTTGLYSWNKKTKKKV